MRKKHDSAPSSRTLLGSKVSEKVAHLLTEIEKEPVPELLLELAKELQQELAKK
jgi:pantoate kinase